MPKNTTRLKTSGGELDLLVDFNVAADFQEAMGVSPYDGDSGWVRSPKMVRHLVYLAARQQHPDVTEEDVGRILTSQDFPHIIETVSAAVFGKKAVKEGKEKEKVDPGDPAVTTGNGGEG